MAELLKEAIADAKAVREVALQNAKMALEEAFDSKIKSMLSTRLAEELDEDSLDEEYIEEEAEATDEGMSSYEEDDKVKEASYDEDESVDEEINLDELMAELEEMGNMYDEDDDMKEGKKDDDDVKEGKKDDDDVKEGKDDDEVSEAKKDDEMKEGLDIDALIAEIESELEEGKKDDKEVKEAKKKEEEMKEAKEKAERELEEALATVASLKESISEMNLLNSKLLYCNKLFRANALTENQKVKVVDALDKASTAGEAKLVFETLQESFNFTGVEKRAIQEGLGRASKAAGVAPKKVITESVDETVSRFQKLANINK